MIDWVSVGFGGLWILGLGIVTASLSYAYFLAGQQKRGFRQALEMPVFRMIISLGLALFCLGWIGSASVLWERLAWTVLALIFSLQAWLAARRSRA